MNFRHATYWYLKKKLNINQFKNIEDRHICPFCSKEFSQKYSLSKHFLVHAEERPYKCDICSRQFKRSRTLNKHIRTHSQGKPFQCKICEKRLTNGKTLKEHVQRFHSKNKPYVCDTCQKGFIKYSDIVSHLRSHSNEKPFACSKCEKAFKSNQDLKVHKKKHEREEKSLPKKICSLKKKTSQGKSKRLMEKSSLFGNHFEMIRKKFITEEIQPKTSTGYLESVVKKEIEDTVEPMKSEFFELPIIKQEIKTEEFAEEEMPSCSQPLLKVKQEPIEIAGPTCTNQFDDDSFVKEETAISQK